VTAKVLSDFCDVTLGFKSLMNGFFYVSQEDIDRFGIEDEYIEPVLKLADLDDEKFQQDIIPNRWLFSCEKHESDLKGTGAWDYIDWGAHQLAPSRKQSGKSESYKAALEKQGGKEWWRPKAPRHPARLAVRKGYNDRYSPFVFASPVVLDQRLYLLFQKRGVPLEVLTAFACSSLFPLTLETNADLGMGAGVLTLGAGNLRALPCVDLHAIVCAPAWPEVKKRLAALLNTNTPTAFNLPRHPAVVALDEALLDALGIGAIRLSDVHEAVARLANARLGRSRQRQLVRAAASAADLERASEPVVQELKKWFATRVFPNDFLPADRPRREYHFPDGQLQLRFAYLLGSVDIWAAPEFGEEYLVAETHPFIGELILRCLQLGRRVFALPVDGDDATPLLRQLAELRQDFEAAFYEAIDRTSLGSLYRDELGSLSSGSSG